MMSHQSRMEVLMLGALNRTKMALFFSIFFASPCLLLGQVPSVISYQGVLTDNTGAPQNGSYVMQFGLYTGSSGGTALWSESQTVSVAKGVFNVLLGAVNPIPDSLAFDAPYWLQVTVSGSPLPRIELSSSAYSFNTSRIQGRPVSPTSPSSGQVLKWTGSNWAPGTDNSGGAPSGNAGGELTGTYPDPSIAPGAIQINSQNIWQNVTVPANTVYEVTVSCSSPWVAAGAMWNAGNSSSEQHVRVVSSQRSNSGTSWVFDLYNNSTSSLNFSVGIACIELLY